jgi:hypothetical protein
MSEEGRIRVLKRGWPRPELADEASWGEPLVERKESDYVSILGKASYHDHIDLGFRKGVSSRTSPADTIRFNFRARSSSNSCPRVFPSFRITLSRESGWTRIPILPRPLVSNRLSIFGPLVTQASALCRTCHSQTKREKKGGIETPYQ